MFSVAITTAPRPNDAFYYDQTKESLADAGFTVYHTELDFPLRLGIVPRFRKALYNLIRFQPAAERYIVFQDDIQVHAHLKETLECTLPEPPCVASLYLSEGREAPEGWSQLEFEDYPLHVGACGLMFDQDTAWKLVTSPPFPRTDRLGSQLALWCKREGIPFWVHSPSLIEHTGEVSTKG